MGNVGSRHQWVYRFNEFKSLRTLMANEGQLPLNLLGGKGLGLAEMTELGLPVPPGLIITTEACSRYFEAGGNLQSEIWHQVLEALKKLEVETEKKLGDPKNPLLVSCRSGARASMPGMMNSILNIGLNQQVVDGMLHDKGDESFVYDLYRRLIQMFACVVKNVDDEPFEDILSENRKQAGIKSDAEFSGDQWKKICDQFENTYRKETGQGFPQDPLDQIYSATKAVFESWNGRRAVDYRNATGIPHDWGTAVNIVTMVFGNRDSNSATGVCFSRNPDTGENGLYGDFLINAQGEDVVAGIRNTIPVVKLAEHFPDLYHDFKHTVGILETHYRDMQDVEFTIEQGKLWILQTRSGKRTARAAIKIAVDLVNEGIISPKEALMRVSPEEVDAVLHNNFDEKAKAASLASGNLIATGVNASPGAAVGAAALSAETAEKWGKEGKAVIMVRPFTKPDDIHGMLASKGILTAEGGATSHAAVVARQFGVPCIVGANTIKIDLKKKQIHGNGLCVNEGDTLSIDGSSGECFIGSIATRKASFEKQKDLNEMLRWADQEKRLRVLANADQPADALKAIRLGAEGIGLCRTEHMFFNEKRLPIVQKMILTKNDSERDQQLAALLQFQRADFAELIRAMDGRPITIRLIDPPLHEFLPDKESMLLEVHDLKKLENPPGLTEKKALLQAITAMHETNPMMGLRGVRLSIVFGKIVSMQVRAIFEAACAVQRDGTATNLEIMIPLVSHVNELKEIQPKLEKIANDVMDETGIDVKYKFGTMVELPRACVTADSIARVAEFFSFGTNDLTQMTFGFSRDDAEAGFLLEYVKRGILEKNPFKTIDQDGVGELMKQAILRGRQINSKLPMGVCGEHGGDPESIHFFDEVGLDYISCSTYRIPAARLAAAQATLKRRKTQENSQNLK